MNKRIATTKERINEVENKSTEKIQSAQERIQYPAKILCKTESEIREIFKWKNSNRICYQKLSSQNTTRDRREMTPQENLEYQKRRAIEM